jgi:probable rRNA maturation factor
MELQISFNKATLIPGLTQAESAALRLLCDVGNPDAEVSLVLTNDNEIQRLNAEWRGKNYPTDVLSWPQDDPKVLGDVVISTDTAARQAERRQWTIEEECALLLVHGILHLLGFEDETEKGSERMKQWERNILGKPLDLIVDRSEISVDV